jgi:hypothetical protein
MKDLCEYNRLIDIVKERFPYVIDFGWQNDDNVFYPKIKQIVSMFGYSGTSFYPRLITAEHRWLLSEYRGKMFEARFQTLEDYIQVKLMV